MGMEEERREGKGKGGVENRRKGGQRERGRGVKGWKVK